MVRSRPPRWIVIAALVAIAGCTSGPTAAPPSVAASAAEGSPRPASPATTQTAASAMSELPPSSTVLAPSRYTRSGFEPRITFEVGADDWQTGQLLDGFFDIQQDPGTPDVVAIQFALPTGVHGPGDTVVRVVTARAAVAAIEAEADLVVLGSSDSRMGGLSGLVVEVENPADSGAHVEILRTLPGRLGIDPGRRLWIALFDSPEGLVAIMVGGSVSGWDEALLAAEPVLETITIGG